eukprot:jgi/Picsp_1/1964/NSC_05430-R1_protein
MAKAIKFEAQFGRCGVAHCSGRQVKSPSFGGIAKSGGVSMGGLGDRKVGCKSWVTDMSASGVQGLLVLGELEVDWSDPDVQIGALGAFLGIAMGIGVPIFYISRDERDEERLEEIRSLNRATKAETGEYMSDEEIESMRPARWTDRREFVDDD